MSRFIYGPELKNEISKLIKEAFEHIIFISPYIKLHEDLKDELLSNPHRNELKITIVFGKNENDASKSFPIEELNFFKIFPNLEIKYEERLHAKYYSNTQVSILTSMNLYKYSFNHNIEFGVLTEFKLIGSNKLDSDAINYFDGVIERAQTVYKQVAEFERKLGGLKKVYKGVKILEDNVDAFYDSKGAKKRIDYQKSNAAKTGGYCIRTGAKIPFNPKIPFAKDAYESWKRYKNEEYSEKYCHFTGESSNGETSFKRPILRKNWKEASKYIKK